MNSKNPKHLLLIITVFLIASFTSGTIFNNGVWWFTIISGALFGWAICAPIIRISSGRVPFLIFWAAFPFFFIILMGYLKVWEYFELPSRTLLTIPGVMVCFILSLSYYLWLRGVPARNLFRKSWWSEVWSKWKMLN